MVLCEFSISPLGKGESVSAYVARSIEIIEKSGLPHLVGPMGTCVEGDWDEVFDLIRSCFRSMTEDCDRVTASIKVDYRRDRSGRIRGKIDTIERRLGRPVRRVDHE